MPWLKCIHKWKNTGKEQHLIEEDNHSPMTLSATIEAVKKWSLTDQVDFTRRISQNVTVGIRSILSYTDVSDAEKLEAIKWLNEFLHRNNNLTYDLERGKNADEVIENIGINAQHYGKMHKVTGGEIAGCFQIAYKSKTRNHE